MGRIDLSKLAELRERHARLHESYRGTAERARDMSRDVGRLISEAASESDNEVGFAMLSKPADELAAIGAKDLEAARLDPRAVRRITAAKVATAKQHATAKRLADELASSVILMESLNQYALRFEQTV
jgi:hypothetical protein